MAEDGSAQGRGKGTAMNRKFDFFPDKGERIVYVRPVEVIDLPEELQAELGELDRIYAVHNVRGERLALVRDRSLAFFLARQHDLEPVSVN